MIKSRDVSVVVPSYARPWNIPVICESLLNYGFTDIHIVDNWQDDNLLRAVFTDDLASEVNILKTGMNCRTAGRHLPEFQNSVIATLDDDYLVTRAGWDAILEAWDGSGIVAQVPESNFQFSHAYGTPFINIGYGSLFHRSWVGPIVNNLINSKWISEDDWLTFSDRILTTFVGQWTAIEATDDTLVRLRNPGGDKSDVDKSSIHLQNGYWQKQWDLVLRVAAARRAFREKYMKRDHLSFGSREQMEYLSRAAYGDCRSENG